MSKQLDIVLDLETTSKKVEAAVFQLAAVACDFTQQDSPYLKNQSGYTEAFNIRLDLLEQYLKGADFDKDTQTWWQGQKEEAKKALYFPVIKSLKEGLNDFGLWIEALKEMTGCTNVCVWAQGSDFDIPKLRKCYERAGIDEKEIPFKYFNVRCARTYNLEHLSEIAWEDRAECFESKNDTIYGLIPPVQVPADLDRHKDAHDALFDSLKTAWNVWSLMNRGAITTEVY